MARGNGLRWRRARKAAQDACMRGSLCCVRSCKRNRRNKNDTQRVFVNRRRLIVGAASGIVGIASAVARPALAQASKLPVRMICGFPPGGLTDAVARSVAERLGAHLNRTIFVDNRSGASGQIGAAAFARLPSDGNSIMVASLRESMLAPRTYKSLAYDPLKDFQPVSRLGEFPYVIAVGPQAPVKTFPELVSWAKAHPKEMSIGTPGTGSPIYFHALLMRSLFGGDPVIAQFAGGPPLLSALSGGQISAAVNALGPDMIAMQQSGRTKMLAVTGPKRMDQFPDMPTFEALKAPTIPVGWNALFLPRGTPMAQVQYWNEGVRAISKLQVVQARFLDFGLTVAPTTPQGMHDLMVGDTHVWSQIVKATGFELLS
jgi:tripartite-type tricarboxylate transporter receptor subunit TctC